MKQILQTTFKKGGVEYSNISSPSSNDTRKQVTNLKEENGLLQYEVDGGYKSSNVASNPNLLINGDFKVNQRGETSYSTNNTYSVDRVQIKNNATVTPKTVGIGVTFPKQYAVIRYILEDKDIEKLKGQTVTFSAKISNANLNRLSREMNIFINNAITEEVQIKENGIFSCTATVPNDATSMDCRIITYSSGNEIDTFDLEYWKLEIGKVATPLSPKPYAEELAMCQRYYFKINKNDIKNKYQLYAVAQSTYRVYQSMIYFPNIMRTSPTIKLFSSNNDAVGFLYNEKKKINQEFSTGYISDNGFYYGNKNGDMAINDIINGYYSADAEIY